MAQTIGSVLIDVKADTSKLVQGMSSAERTIKNTTANMKTAVKGLVAAYVSFEGINTFENLMEDSINTADEMGKLSEKFGTTSEELSKLVYAGKFAGVELNTLSAALGAMIRRTNNFTRDGGGAAAKALEELGISADFARKNFTDTDTTFKIIADRLRKLPDGFQKTAIAQDIFSKSAADVVAMANMGSEELSRLGDEAERTGNVIGSDFAESAAQLNDQKDALQTTIEGLSNRLAQKLVPATLSAVRAFQKLLGIQTKLADFELEEKVLSLQRQIKSKESQIENAWSFNKGKYTSELRALKNALRATQDELKLRQEMATTLEKEREIAATKLSSTRENSTIQKAKEKELENIKKVNAQIEDDYIKSQLDQYDYQKYTLGMKYAEEVKYAEDVDKLNSAFIHNMESIDNKRLEDLDKLKDKGEEVAEDIGSSFENTFTNTFADALATGKASMNDFANSILSDIATIMIRSQIAAPIASGLSAGFGSLFSFANGGIMTSEGAIPMRTYATGGVATSPQMALFGEGSMNEAFIPLPDGNSVPVTMRGNNGSGSITVNIENKTSSEITADQISEMTKTNERGEVERVLNIVIEGANRNINGFRNNLRNVL